MSHALTEITPLSESDCFYIVDRTKKALTFPLHHHMEFEINYLHGASGAHRVVGDKMEVIEDEDLVLIGGENVDHVWEQGECKSSQIREITIQFSRDLLSSNLLSRNQFAPVRTLLDRVKAELTVPYLAANAAHDRDVDRGAFGLAFTRDDIDRVRDLLNKLPHIQDKFEQFLGFLDLLYRLGLSDGARELSSGPYAVAEASSESRRVLKVKRYIRDHYSEPLPLSELAAMVGMTPSSFSRFFRKRAGRTLSEYITDVRLGHAARMLVDTTHNIAEICYMCGYNNISNFNRHFKARRGLTPKEFRALNKKLGTLV